MGCLILRMDWPMELGNTLDCPRAQLNKTQTFVSRKPKPNERYAHNLYIITLSK